VLQALELGAKAGLSEGPNTVVFIFLLGPGDSSVLVLLEGLLNSAERPWGELLNSDKSDVLRSILNLLSFQVVVDLASAEDYLANLVGSHVILSGVVDDALECSALGKFFKGGSGGAILKELLGGDDN
jgi:hypothetical protein